MNYFQSAKKMIVVLTTLAQDSNSERNSDILKFMLSNIKMANFNGIDVPCPVITRQLPKDKFDKPRMITVADVMTIGMLQFMAATFIACCESVDGELLSKRSSKMEHIMHAIKECQDRFHNGHMSYNSNADFTKFNLFFEPA